MHGRFLIQTFYHELKRTSQEHLDAAAGGAFFSLQVPTAKEFIEKMVANQGWDGDCLQHYTCDVHQVDGIDMIAANMDLLMKKLEASSNMETTKIMDAHMTCVVCGNVDHSENDCLETREEASFINNGNTNGFHNNNFNIQGWNSRPNFPFNNQNGGNYSITFNNQTSIKDLVFGQARIDENLKISQPPMRKFSRI
jgi:3-oxoacyl-[acyl-carrier-protein] synthase III